MAIGREVPDLNKTERGESSLSRLAHQAGVKKWLNQLRKQRQKVKLKVHRRYSPHTAFSVGSLPHRIL
jgi:hypothetical protein